MTRLFDQGCQLMQGFLFSPAVPGADFPALLKNSTSRAHWRVNFGARTPSPKPTEMPDEHSNGRHFGALESEFVGPVRPAVPVPAPAPTSSLRPVEASEGGVTQKARALRWAHRFVGRDG
jgi:hypothetical protein